MRIITSFAVAAALFLAGCTAPPKSDYVTGGGPSASAVDVGRNASGEACTQQASGDGRGSDIFCGTWEQPSAHIRQGESADVAALPELATASPWRAALDVRLSCTTPSTTTILGHQPAMLLQCTRRVGGWPQVAIVSVIDGRAYFADGVLPSLPVIERAIGVSSGQLAAGAPAPSSGADALLAARLAAQSFNSGDVGQFERLMQAGGRANLSQSYAAAEQAFRAALVLQQKALGHDNPDTVAAMVPLAVQLSDQGRYAEADQLFAQAARLTPAAADRTAPARLAHYRALDAVNQGDYRKALGLLTQATAAYAALLPTDVTLHPPAPRAVFAEAGPTGDLPSGDALVVDPTQRVALIGVIETLRYRAIVLRALKRPDESEAAIRLASTIAAGSGLHQPILTARLYRTAATTDGLNGQTEAAQSGLLRSSADFDVSLPGTRPVAETALLSAANLQRQGRNDDALAQCRSGVALLRSLKVGTSADLLDPCLTLYARQAASNPADQQTLLAEMFEAAQLDQGGITAQQIALATARLGEASRNPKVGAAIRRRQDAGSALSALYRARESQRQSRQEDLPQGPQLTPAELDSQIAAAQAELADADAAVQAAAPNYGQLVQQVVPAADVFAALAPDEAFASITLSGDSGWVFLLRDGHITAHPIGASPSEIAALVSQLRASIEIGNDNKLPTFNVAVAQRLYAVTLGEVEDTTHDLKALAVAPTGPLLAIPFGALLTGPADAAHLGDAPWLIRRYAIAHVPSAANFVSLRRIANGSHARQPWFGLGDFHPIPLALAQRSFPAACKDSAEELAGLPPLPFAGRELDAARALLGGSTRDELTGARFTTAAVLAADLKDMRVLHFAAHALLPEELRCESQPAIVTSVPPGATDASGAFLTASDVTGLDLDADLVVLSACNSGGPNGATGGGTGGESLSGLARSFFYAGARALMVTHWSVNDQTSAFLVADTLRRLHEGTTSGAAEALRDAELGMINGAGHELPASLAHPFYWAPFALIGEGRVRASTS